MHPLNPSIPVWVVVHGKDSSENADIMKQLARSLAAHAEAKEFQVVTIDWSEAAKDGVFIQDAPWAVGVGQWAAHQLTAAGFDPANINVAGWSHGSYVAFELGKELQRATGVTLNALVALDAARNIPLFSGYDHSPVDFAGVSHHALAIDSSIVAGANSLAATADIAFQIRTPGSINLNTLTKHKLAVTGFSAILDKDAESEGPFTDHISIMGIMQGTGRTAGYRHDAYAGAFEGVIDVGIDGVQALPQQLRYEDARGTEHVVSFRSIYG